MKTLNLIITIAIVVLSLNCFAGTKNTMAGIYTVGNSAAANFKTLSAALTALENSATTGAVTFIVDKSAYDQKEIINAIAKTSGSNNVAFINAEEQNDSGQISDDAANLASK